MRKPCVLGVATAAWTLFMLGAVSAQEDAVSKQTCAALAHGQALWEAHPSAAGVELAYLAGRPSEAGFFKYRLRFPAGFAAAPHTHSVDLHMTVLCGGVQLSLPGQPEMELPPGAHQHFPVGLVHGEASEQGAVLEITGIGPVATTMVEGTKAGSTTER